MPDARFQTGYISYLLQIEMEEEPKRYPFSTEHSRTTLESSWFGVLKMLSGMKGSLMRFCMAMNGPNKPAETDTNEMNCGELHSASFAVTIA
jgi:hypothetical protein